MFHRVPKERWPSWLWRQVKVTLNIVSWSRKWRGFESHSLHQLSFDFCALILPVIMSTTQRSEVQIENYCQTSLTTRDADYDNSLDMDVFLMGIALEVTFARTLSRWIGNTFFRWQIKDPGSQSR